MIRVCENMLVPINKIPPEILALIPDFWDTRDRDKDVIALTHVCHTWREIFVSRSSLWTNFDCSDKEKTRVYFERSKSSPINLSLDLSEGILRRNPIFQIIPHATGRLKSLFARGLTKDVETITSHLSHPAPLLERLSICSHPPPAQYRAHALPSALFNGDLSSLRMLRLQFVYTGLPWRNMVNLTSFTLSDIPSGAFSTGQLLDFLESAPCLEEVDLCYATPTTGIQGGRLVSLACLKSMVIESGVPCSTLLDHLLIPAGAKLEIGGDPISSSIEQYLPRSLDNLENFPDFAVVELCLGEGCQGMKFSGPNGQVNITLRDDRTDPIPEFLAKLDTSKIERLKIDRGHLLSRESLYEALLPMKDLRTLTLSKCKFPYTLIHALEPRSSEVMVCPKLEELFLMPYPHKGMSRIMVGIIEMAAVRASRGKKLRTFRIFGGLDTVDLDVSELGKYVCNAEYVRWNPASILVRGRESWV